MKEQPEWKDWEGFYGVFIAMFKNEQQVIVQQQLLYSATSLCYFISFLVWNWKGAHTCCLNFSDLAVNKDSLLPLFTMIRQIVMKDIEKTYMWESEVNSSVYQAQEAPRMVKSL